MINEMHILHAQYSGTESLFLCFFHKEGLIINMYSSVDLFSDTNNNFRICINDLFTLIELLMFVYQIGVVKLIMFSNLIG